MRQLIVFFYSTLHRSPHHWHILIAFSHNVNTVSRILMQFLADKVGHQNTIVFVSAVTILALWFRETRGGFTFDLMLAQLTNSGDC